MRPTAAFMDVIKRIDGGNAVRIFGELAAVAVEAVQSGAHPKAIVQHLETLAFRLEGSDRFAQASEVYKVIAAVDAGDRERWRTAAVTVSLQGLCERGRFSEAAAVVEALRNGGESDAGIGVGVDILMRLAWHYECRYETEASVQCYRLAHALSDGGHGISTVDGHTLERKIRDIRILQMRSLAEEGRHAVATPLHEQTRDLLGLGPMRVYDIMSAHQAAADGQGVYRVVRPGRRIGEPEIRFLDGPVALTSQAGSRDAPPQYIALFRDCLAFPRSNVVLQDDRLIYDLAAHPLSGTFDIRDGVNPDQIMIAAYGSGRALVAAPPERREIGAGLMLFGLQSRNYGHWLLEFIGRMLCFNDRACPDGFPICIDDDMPETHRQIIELIDERARPIIPLSAVPTHFRELGLSPAPTLLPFDMRPGHPVYDSIWPADVFADLRSRVLGRLAERGVDLRRTGRRIVLSRRGFAQRQLLNEAEIVGTLAQHGFEVVHPETLTFAEQIATYHAADIIVGSASSALTNCIFCHPGAKVVALIHEGLSFNFRGYTSMIESSGADLLFVRGITERNELGHPFHANYTVSPDQVLRAIERVGRT
ncbi:glycosyltransferase family 61 protein [Methylobacterium sp. E-066]|uniref:glycosyltransferase family 61 protein n=1 Tax=Methylobacterium sp. E-066 TaxID=2836584 RepID=UPI001FB92887|nr:glycosyltransferase family 61 protein [Methylobacterium sp. E-066]MCJ2142966.1 glycosyltransferase family 61 protein [Methylobacterium sp. E-066]